MIEYLAHVLVVAAIYVMLAESLALLVGELGLMSLTHAALFGVGAYVAAIAATSFGVPFFLALPLAAVVAIFIATVLLLPLSSLSGDRFAIGTLVVQLGLYSLYLNAVEWTGGPMGIRGIPPLSLFGIRFDTPVLFLLPATAGAVLSIWVRRRVIRSSIGRSFRLTRDDPLFAISLGRNVQMVRFQGILIGASLAGVAGALFAHYYQFVSPSSFDEMQAIMILAMVIAGGPQSAAGPAAGALFVASVPEILRFVGFPPGTVGPARAALFGLALVVVAYVRAPQLAAASAVPE